MRICFLGDIRSVHIQKFIKYFTKEHETYLISFDYLGDKRVQIGVDFFNNLGTHVYILKKSQLLFSPFITRRIIHIINPDLVQAHFVTNYGFLGAFSGVHPLVISAMGDDILVHPVHNKLYHILVTYALHNADFLTCDGVNSITALKNFGVSEKRIALIYPGIDMLLFHPSKKQKLFSNKIIFYPRGFDEIYDTVTLFKVIKIVHQHLPDVRFLLLGVGTELTRFKNAIMKIGMNESVQYLGYVPNNELPVYLASSDISVTTSLSDGGIPVSTIEAMACGVPVISTNAGDAMLWIKNGETGYVVDKCDYTAMATRIIELLIDDERRLQFGKKSRQIVEIDQDYNFEMEKIEFLYNKLIMEKCGKI